ncbi:MAG: aminotransferase class V-fold PLP-dependent enzyme [Gammaproteobacteria bacterium]|nr:MAG: aminotransferase class V-fold PLP-dependent enzyme [Gammaproteobacteria bacterium]
MILLNPGPVTLTDRVRAALTAGDWCHREPEFAALMQEINRRITHLYDELAEDFSAVTLTGSGTSAVEAMLASFAPDDGKGATLVLANGVYGERMAKMLRAHRKPCELLQSEWTAAIDLDVVSGVLDRHPELTHIATVHHETTTGRLNDMDALGALCVRRGLALLLDGVSSFGAEAIKADDWNLDAVAGTANKCLHGVPGLSFVVARNRLWAQAAPPVASVYLDLYGYYAGQYGTGYSPFTQSVQVAFALREALLELEESGGWRARRRTYVERAARIHRALMLNSVGMLLREEDCSCVLRTYLLPDRVGYTEVHDTLKAAGFVIYAGQGDLAPDVFRIAYMGDITAADLDALCDALSDAFEPAA